MVSRLFIKKERSGQMVPVTSMPLNPEQGIASGVFCSPFRQILINTEETLRSFGISPGQLRENIVLNSMDVHDMPSGAVLRIGDAQIRLTFHCEPCFKIKDLVSPKAIMHQRGYLAQVVHPGVVSTGDAIDILPIQMDAIPYDPVERIVWLLKKQENPIFASDLVWRAGLPFSYCRALPAIIERHSEIDKKMIKFRMQANE
jgi:hypothetical protein